jgi:hypothetical protein
VLYMFPRSHSSSHSIARRRTTTFSSMSNYIPISMLCPMAYSKCYSRCSCRDLTRASRGQSLGMGRIIRTTTNTSPLHTFITLFVFLSRR